MEKNLKKNLYISPWITVIYTWNYDNIVNQLHSSLYKGLVPCFPSGSAGKEPTWQCRRLKRHGFDPWVGKITWRRKRQCAPIFLPGKSHRQRSLAGYSPWGHKELDTCMHMVPYLKNFTITNLNTSFLFKEKLRPYLHRTQHLQFVRPVPHLGTLIMVFSWAILG